MSAARRADVAVVGGGPAAWAAAAACAQAGRHVTLLAPDPEAAWSATYGVWLDELEGVELADPRPADAAAPNRSAGGPSGSIVARRWDVAQVVTAGGTRHLARPYGVLDNAALADRLRGRAAAHGVTVVRGEAAGCAPGPGGATVVTRTGVAIDATVVVDATGAPPALVRAPRPPAWQVAHGVVARGVTGVVEPGSCLLMDWTPVPGEPDPQPSFLYALDLGDGRTLLEETVLAAVRPLSSAVLARRLARRLSERGVTVVDPERVETVRIPMGLVAPRPQGVVGFGAAGGLVHPATGYSVAASLRAAPRLAAALAGAGHRRAVPAAAVAAGWDAVWPADRRRARELENFGLRAVLRMDQATSGAFFAAFFALPAPLWSGYLSGTLPAREVAGLMARLFRAAPWSLRRRLAGGDPRSLWRALRP